MRRFFVAILLATPVVAMADAGADGAAIFKQNCAICHGADGKGHTPVGRSLKLKDLASRDVQKKSNADLRKIISDGKAAMPPFKDKLDEPGLDAVIAFIRSLQE